MPTQRELKYARDYWRYVRDLLRKEGNAHLFADIYSEKQLNERFALDHFIPWSFVVHDLVWNLAPVETATNSSKGDRVPNLDRYISPMAKLHHSTLRFSKCRPEVEEMYVECFKSDITDLERADLSTFRRRLEDVMVPLARVAENQGFESGWQLRTEP
jgi:hypothetical protein